MVFSSLHWVPSLLAALLTFAVASNYGKPHRGLSMANVLLALLGLVGYISVGRFHLFPIDFHTLHSWIGFVTLTLTVFLFGR